MNVPVWILIGFNKDKQDSQKLNNDTFFILPVISTQCIISTEKSPNSCMLINYDDGDYSQSYGQIKEVFRALTKNDILQTYIIDHDFRSSNDRADDVG